MSMQRMRIARPVAGNQVADAVRAIACGQLVVLPTETVYGFAIRPGDEATAERVRRLKGRDEQQPFTYHLASPADLERLAVAVPPRIRRLLDRYWPGPLTVVLPDAGGALIGARVPADDFTRAVLDALGQPLWMTSVNRSGSEPLCDPDAIAEAFGDEIDLLADAGPSPLGTASTVVRFRDGELQVLREGILSAEEVLVTAADTVLFVCTGNTCRSPMAEALATRRLAEALGVPANRLLHRGLRFASAGIATLPGMPVSEGAAAVAAEVGLDLSRHRTAIAEPSLLQGAARIYCLSAAHRQRLLEMAPDLRERLELLDPEGKDIADPFGGDLPTYRAVRDQIDAAVRRRLPDWQRLLAG